MKVTIKETRGRKRKYNFTSIEIGESISIKNSNISNILFLAKRQNSDFPKRKFRCYTAENGDVVLTRTS